LIVRFRVVIAAIFVYRTRIHHQITGLVEFLKVVVFHNIEEGKFVKLEG
jgi:hypothetical protein